MNLPESNAAAKTLGGSSLKICKKNAGLAQAFREFRRLVLNIIEQDSEHEHMPDYAVFYEADGDIIVFQNRGNVVDEVAQQINLPALRSETYEKAKELAPGWDIYLIEAEWRDWLSEPPRDADAAFVGFCRKWFEKRGRP